MTEVQVEACKFDIDRFNVPDEAKASAHAVLDDLPSYAPVPSFRQYLHGEYGGIQFDWMKSAGTFHAYVTIIVHHNGSVQYACAEEAQKDRSDSGHFIVPRPVDATLRDIAKIIHGGGL